MFHIHKIERQLSFLLHYLLFAGLALLLAGCFGTSVSPPETSGGSSAVPAYVHNIGTGPVKVGVILPFSQPQGPNPLAISLRNAAELALAESGGSTLTLMLRDSLSTPQGSREAAQSLVDSGAELLLGPIFSAHLREAGRVARAHERPLIGFSTDTNVAARNVYLLSFLIENQVERIVEFAAHKGKKSLAALIPENDYGNVALAAFQSAAAQNNIRVLLIERYRPQTIDSSIQKVSAVISQIDGLFVADLVDGTSAIANALTRQELSNHKLQILGTGVWNDPRVLKLGALQGAWFAAPDNAGFNAFAQRYRARFGNDPPRIASLMYDSVSLAAALAARPAPERFSEATLTNPSGFNGADGLFRFHTDGHNERSLAILQISNGAATIIQPPFKTFQRK